ncbi:DUF6443 domain-containing protein [Bacteroides nordii]|uniref:DUF6443 domain-containing protein n=1 Tax=Bacteroides nordii TaxID=291645 RepID=UPI002A8139C5|nr:DUF6443 domain-containing protein [Bacteroides nordii]
MKHSILFIAYIVYCICAMSQSQDQNYIRTKTMTDETDPTKFIESIQYFDGLGRPVQTVQVGITPEHNSLVTLQEYDVCGRNVATWLPAVISGKDGAFTGSPEVKSAAIASNINDSKPYSKTIYEASPLNRILEQYGPGSKWHSWNYSIKTNYLTNEANGKLSCMCFTITGSNLNTSLVKPIPFAPGELYVTEVKNEEGYSSYEFKNKQGQVILTRQLNSGTAHDTYYVYDDFDNLSYVIPPMLADKLIKENKQITDNSLEVKQYAYLYKYDERNRCVRKRLPGCDWIYYVYDRGDRLIFTQNAEQRKTGEWLYSIPDAFGRIVQTGICYNANISNDNYKDKLVVGTYEGRSGYSFSNFSPEYVRVLTINYYDNYDFLLDIKQERRTMLEYEERQGYGKRYNVNSYSAKGLLTGTYVNTSISGYEDIFDEYSALYYDDRGRLIQTKKCWLQELGVDNEYIAYNFQGKPIKKLHEHSILTLNQTNEIYSHDYDHAGRLIATKHKLNGGSEIVIVQNTYNELGQLSSTQTNNQDALKTNYKYNIRSWLADSNNSIYKEKLEYDKIGNITSINDYRESRSGSSKWNISMMYDGLSRMIEYMNKDGGFGTPNARFIYDKNGNVKNIYRSMNTSTGTIFPDFMTISYLGNQIQTVEDSAEDSQEYNSYDFKDMAGVGKLQSYEYDLNGAVTKDPYRCATIENNYLNLPQRIVVDNPLVSGSIEYLYLATGKKLASTSSVSLRHSLNPSEIAGGAPMDESTDRLESTYYCGNIIYKIIDGAICLDRILIDNGYIKDGNYYFYIKDHIGNNRATTNSTGQVKAMDDYFPFGMPIKDSKWEETPQRYRFGGKEFETLMRLNLYDSHARFYDPALDRFMSVDPLCEKYYSISPYAYCLNNPLGHIDPDGKFPWPAIPIFLSLLFESQPVNAPTLNRVSNARNMEVAWNSYNEGVLSNFIPGAKMEAVSTRVFIQEPVEKIVRKTVTSEVREEIGKFVPNPFGKRGGQAHQDKVAEAMEQLKSNGFEDIRTERTIYTPNGEKTRRAVDVRGINPTTGEVKYVQVGRQNKNETPVARERRALDDIEKATGQRPIFIPYN